MSATRVRRVFATPFVVTLAAACGGKAPPPEPIAATEYKVPVDAAPLAMLPDAVETAAMPEPIAKPPDAPIHRNPPPPQHKATRDLTWKITRTGTGEAAKCKAQQVEACQQGKKPCKPPIESHLCVYEDSSKTEAEYHKYPLFVVQKEGDEACYIKDSNPPEQTYCPDEWELPKK